ncbi:MAG: DUF3916 domain-containing protein [Brevundimonas sp.]|uniref:DUF3916 domain-containing protein n=1 Tax=Brevundimonas sp. TaxID=1871086 RepID=UPI0040331D6A
MSFPPGPFEGRGYYHWKLPMPRALVSSPTARQPVQAICVQVLMDAAERLAAEKPQELNHARVFAIIGFPDVFSSEVCIFFDPQYLASFCARDRADERWTRKLGEGLVSRLGLSLPTGFEERGFDTLSRDDTFEPPYVEEGETWLIGEPE